MMKKRIKQISALLLTATLSFSAVMLPKVQAAIAVETDKTDCSVEINVAGGQLSELKTLPIVVNLYKVADVTEEAKYITEDVFNGYGLDFSTVNSETTAEAWLTMAEEAKKAIDEGVMGPTIVVNMADGSAVVENLTTGLYLVDAQTAESAYYKYDFTPYLISLPNNYYKTSGDDTWVYDLTGVNAIGLKPEKTDRYGNLTITKSLDAFNASLGNATFVFQVEASKTDIDTNETKVVYSDVVSMEFTAAGTESITIENIPAGAQVTVTEVYSGASYKLTSDAVQTDVIEAAGSDTPAEVTFNNTYDDRMNGGNGLVNTFTYNGGNWAHQATGESNATIVVPTPEVEETEPTTQPEA